MLALIIGTLLAVGALGYVLFPLFSGMPMVPRRSFIAPVPSAASSEQEAVVALREIEFDRATGKLSDADYTELKSRYTDQALAAMRRSAPDVVDAADDIAEAALVAYKRRLKSCRTCGPRAEPDAIYCSTCGLFLPGACSACGAAVHELGAAYCAACGRQLAA